MSMLNNLIFILTLINIKPNLAPCNECFRGIVGLCFGQEQIVPKQKQIIPDNAFDLIIEYAGNVCFWRLNGACHEKFKQEVQTGLSPIFKMFHPMDILIIIREKGISSPPLLSDEFKNKELQMQRALAKYVDPKNFSALRILALELIVKNKRENIGMFVAEAKLSSGHPVLKYLENLKYW